MKCIDYVLCERSYITVASQPQRLSLTACLFTNIVKPVKLTVSMKSRTGQMTINIENLSKYELHFFMQQMLN